MNAIETQEMIKAAAEKQAFAKEVEVSRDGFARELQKGLGKEMREELKKQEEEAAKPMEEEGFFKKIIRRLTLVLGNDNFYV